MLCWELTGSMGQWEEGSGYLLEGNVQGMANSRLLELRLSSPKREHKSVTGKATSAVESV